jgi:hypothetical protein
VNADELPGFAKRPNESFARQPLIALDGAVKKAFQGGNVLGIAAMIAPAYRCGKPARKTWVLALPSENERPF